MPAAISGAPRRLDLLCVGDPAPVHWGRRQLHRHRQEQVRREEQSRQAVHERPECADKVSAFLTIKIVFN
jgi:hypothetical protein